MIRLLPAVGGAVAALCITCGCGVPVRSAPLAPEDTSRKDIVMETAETATFAAGCFWGVEAMFRRIEGVLATEVGYTGGHTENPSYKDVCAGDTGHAEAVKVSYDPSKVTYEQLLDAFWNGHNPTTLNRQGPDVGSQYRSAVFFHSPDQEALARASKERLDASGKHPRPIVTEIAPAGTFYRAEEYHQQYLEKRGLASCHL